MLAVILALMSAIGYGSSDFYAGLATRTASVIQVSLLACLAAVVVVLAALPFAADHRPSGAALAWGAAAGAGGTLGGIALYLGFRPRRWPSWRWRSSRPWRPGICGCPGGGQAGCRSSRA
jgi:hypothetical protein